MVSESLERILVDAYTFVLILVLVEDGLRDSITTLNTHNYGIVLILVLVEDGLRVEEINAEKLFDE